MFNKQKAMFILRSSKTHCEADLPQIIKLSQTHKDKKLLIKEIKFANRGILCPYRALQQYIKLQPLSQSTNENFFIFRDKSTVQAYQFRNVLREIITKCGFDSHLYDCHRFRTGRSLDRLKMGYSVESIKKIGCWKSNAIYTYLNRG